jgi:glycerol kinase
MLLGIDLGTGSAKALLLATDGTVIGEASSSYPVHAPHPGWAESEPADWWLYQFSKSQFNPIRVSSSQLKRIVLVVHKTVKQNQ